MDIWDNVDWRTKPKTFGDGSIDEDLFRWILNNLARGSILLELGSGRSTIELCKHYEVISIEHDVNWINRYPSRYIFAPLKKVDRSEWYDIDILKAELPVRYDMILIDGPPSHNGPYRRGGFLRNLNLFRTVPMVFDDLDRNNDLSTAKRVSRKVQKDLTIIKGATKDFGFIK